MAQRAAAAAGLGGGDRLLAREVALEEVLDLVGRPVELHRRRVEREARGDCREGGVEGVVLLLLGVRAVVLADRGGDEAVRAEGAGLDLGADLGVRDDGPGAGPDRDLAAVHGDDAVRAVEDRAPHAERAVVELDVAVRCAEEHPHAELAASAVEEVGRVRLVGADDAVGAAPVHADAPLRDVEVVRAPVTVVAAADVVVEAPEHRPELVDAARGELVGVGPPLRGPQPHVPVDVGVRRALLLRVRGVVPEADGVRGAAELLAAATVVGVDELHVADAAVARDHARGAEDGPGALHRAGLEDAARGLLRGDDRLDLLDAEGEGLLAVDVLAGLHRLDGHVAVPVVGCGDADHVDGGVGEDLAEVGDGAAGREGDAGVGVGLVDLRGAGLAARAVAVADGGDADAEAVLPAEGGGEARAGLDAEAEEGDGMDAVGCGAHGRFRL